jgi:hypothetical protein
MKLTTNVYLMSRLRMMEPYLHSPICLHRLVLNYIIKYRDNFTFYYTELCTGSGNYIFESQGEPHFSIHSCFPLLLQPISFPFFPLPFLSALSTVYNVSVFHLWFWLRYSSACSCPWWLLEVCLCNPRTVFKIMFGWWILNLILMLLLHSALRYSIDYFN